MPLSDVVLQKLRRGAEAVVEMDHELLAGLLGGREHLFGLLGVHGHRLFAEYMLASGQGSYGNLGMEEIRQGDADGVYVGFGKQLFIVRIGGRRGIEGPELRQELFIQVADGNQLGLIRLGINFGMVTAHAQPDHAYLDFHVALL